MMAKFDFFGKTDTWIFQGPVSRKNETVACVRTAAKFRFEPRAGRVLASRVDPIRQGRRCSRKTGSKVGDWHDTVRKKSEKHQAGAPSRPKMTTLSMKSPILEQSSGSSGSTGSGGNCVSRVRADPLPHAPGARMTVVTQTPSN